LDTSPKVSYGFCGFDGPFNEDILKALGERDISPKKVEGRTASFGKPFESCKPPMPVDMAREDFPMVLVPTEDDDSDELREAVCRDAEPPEEGDIDSGWSPGGAPPIV
jgi:hypothetical protein